MNTDQFDDCDDLWWLIWWWSPVTRNRQRLILQGIAMHFHRPIWSFDKKDDASMTTKTETWLWVCQTIPPYTPLDALFCGLWWGDCCNLVDFKDRGGHYCKKTKWQLMLHIMSCGLCYSFWLSHCSEEIFQQPVLQHSATAKELDWYTCKSKLLNPNHVLQIFCLFVPSAFGGHMQSRSVQTPTRHRSAFLLLVMTMRNK